jgi:hypothetical protein
VTLRRRIQKPSPYDLLILNEFPVPKSETGEQLLASQIRRASHVAVRSGLPRLAVDLSMNAQGAITEHSELCRPKRKQNPGERAASNCLLIVSLASFQPHNTCLTTHQAMSSLVAWPAWSPDQPVLAAKSWTLNGCLPVTDNRRFREHITSIFKISPGISKSLPEGNILASHSPKCTGCLAVSPNFP